MPVRAAAREAPEGVALAHGGRVLTPLPGGAANGRPIGGGAVVVFTSGSTGRPRGAVLSHGALRMIERHRVTLLSVVPTMLGRLLNGLPLAPSGKVDRRACRGLLVESGNVCSPGTVG